MIRALTAYTTEPDNVDGAVHDILEQLDLEKNLLAHSTGILFCYLDFITTGVLKALCDSLPFDVTGCTSMGFAAPGAAGEIMLTLLVLTSDDIEFSAGLSEPLAQEVKECTAELYRRVSQQQAVKPSFIFASAPLSFSGDIVVDALDQASGGVPVFGIAAVDVEAQVRSPLVIYNGGAYPDRLALLTLTGGVKAKFFMDRLPGELHLDKQAVITSVEDNRIITLDNMPAVDCLEKIGLVEKGVAGKKLYNVMYAFPISVEYPDSRETKVFTVYGINADGSLTSGSSIPPGGTMRIGSVTSDLVLKSAAHITDLIKKSGDCDVILIFSCFSHNLALMDSQDELKLIQEQAAGFSAPHIWAYAGGEICPRYTTEGQLTNRFFQYTIIACTLG
ncbi:MAG: FIST C-terminal domain-containing protein [Spirochaetales bacterium]|jgi:hypothetical protein|nr:FIST C-terminal domain-containing protein [Spirochaetales bacterium]